MSSNTDSPRPEIAVNGFPKADNVGWRRIATSADHKDVSKILMVGAGGFLLFYAKDQDALRSEDLIGYAGDLGLDVDRFAQDLRAHRGAAHRRDTRGDHLGLPGPQQRDRARNRAGVNVTGQQVRQCCTHPGDRATPGREVQASARARPTTRSANSPYSRAT